MRKGTLLSFAAAILCGAPSAEAQGPPPQPVQLPDGNGKELVEATCTQCHRLNLLTGSGGYTRQGWEALIGSMVGLEGFSHAIVVFHIDRVPEEEKRLTLPVGTDAVERGVLATRSQRRPNGIGVSVVPILHRRLGVLRVLGLDALDGSVVLDIKPYLPSYDAVADAVLPSWAVEPKE